MIILSWTLSVDLEFRPLSQLLPQLIDSKMNYASTGYFFFEKLTNIGEALLVTKQSIDWFTSNVICLFVCPRLLASYDFDFNVINS